MRLEIHAELEYGQKVGVVGDAEGLGSWNPATPFTLGWTEGDVWVGTVELPAVGEVEYKLVTQYRQGFEWESFQGGNRVLDTLPGGSYLTVTGKYGEELDVKRSSEPPPEPKPAPEPEPEPRGYVRGYVQDPNPKGYSMKHQYVQGQSWTPGTETVLPPNFSQQTASQTTAPDYSNAAVPSPAAKEYEQARNDQSSTAHQSDETYHPHYGAPPGTPAPPSPRQKERSRDFYAEAKALAEKKAKSFFEAEVEAPQETAYSSSYETPSYPPPPVPPAQEDNSAYTEYAPPPVSQEIPPQGPEDTDSIRLDFSNLPEGVCRDIAEGDMERNGWLEKLQLVSAIIARESDGNRTSPGVEVLAACGVYLRWLGTCVVACGGDGGVYGPDGATEMGREIFIALEAASRQLYTPGRSEIGEGERALIRQIHPWLPSLSSEFADGVPLARIQYIVQRNDIPEPLKFEIRESIVKKLMYNFGPEGLYAAEELLQVINNAGGCPEDFVEEFTVFVGELKRYFNRPGSLDMLYALHPTLDDDMMMIVDELRAAMSALAMAAVRGGGGEGLTGLEGTAVLRALRAATAVRGHFTSQLTSMAAALSDGDRPLTETMQAYRLVEISLEDLAFVLLTRALHCAGVQNSEEGGLGKEDDAAPGAEGALLQDDDDVWAAWCFTAAQALRQIALSTWRPMECHSVARELEAWSEPADGPVSTPEDAARMLASLRRARRLVEAHTAALTEGYGGVPHALGSALGVPSHTAATFVDATVRAGVPYQLGRLLAPMIRAATRAAGDASPEAVEASSRCAVVGRGVGRLVECARLEPGVAGKSRDGPVVAFVWRVEGNEEVTAAGRHVKGVVVAQELDAGSRLAVRAAQERMPLTATGAGEAAKRAARLVRDLAGQWVTLNVFPDGVQLAPATPAEIADAQAAGDADSNLSLPSVNASVELAHAFVFRDLRSATVDVAGAKATACGDLIRMAERPGCDFKALGGVYIPFGAMEACLRDAGVLNEYERLVAEVEAAAQLGNSPMIDSACRAVRELIASTPFPSDMGAALCAALHRVGGSGRLVVRSSPNVEDLAGMSGSDVHRSVVGVAAGSAREVGRAVQEVWASLFTAAAVLNRRAAGVPQSSAHMGVFIQEMAPAAVSFVLHTGDASGGGDDASGVKPVGGARGEHVHGSSPTLTVELAVGVGETASGRLGEKRGSPWRVEVDRASGDVRTTAFASVGKARIFRDGPAAHLGVNVEAVDYSRQALSVDTVAREALARRLAAVGAALEAEHGAPQSVEGCVVGDDLYVVQSRHQPLTGGGA